MEVLRLVPAFVEMESAPGTRTFRFVPGIANAFPNVKTGSAAKMAVTARADSARTLGKTFATPGVRTASAFLFNWMLKYVTARITTATVKLMKA